MAHEHDTGNAYALGHSRPELDRLIAQSQFIGDLTEHVLHLAGVRPGMRVLDVGCGAGDVSFLALRLVGPEGSVVGVDRSPEAVAVATQRARAAQLDNVRFLTSAIDALQLEEPVDALVGRLVLMYFPKPALVLRHLLSYVKPGGIVAFQEIDTASASSLPICEVYETAGERIDETMRRAGIDIRTGLKLTTIFLEAGLPAPQMLSMARVEHGPDSRGYEWVAQLTRTLLPVMQQTGVATAGEVDVDTLATRMRAEAVSKGSVLVTPAFIGAWGRAGE